jgi:membrane protein
MFGLIRETFRAFVADKAMRLSAALAYYSVFSIAPVLIIAISIAGAVFGDDAARGAIEYQLTDTVGRDSALAVQEMIESFDLGEKSLLMTALGIAVLLFAATGVFAQLKDAMNTIWGITVKPGRGVKAIVRKRLLALSMVLVMGFLLLVSLVISAATAIATRWVGDALPIPGFAFQLLSLVISVGVVTLLFALIFKILPDADVRWKDVWIGAFITAVLFSLGKFLLALYFGHKGPSTAYGAAGALILLLTWVYYSANILMLGAEFTQAYARRRGRRIEPKHNAVRLG